MSECCGANIFAIGISLFVVSILLDIPHGTTVAGFLIGFGAMSVIRERRR